MGYMILLLYLIPLPILVGVLFYTKRNKVSIGEQWVFGQFILWAVFQTIAVYFILQEGTLEEVAHTYSKAITVLAGIALLKAIRMWKKVDNSTKKNADRWKTEAGLEDGSTQYKVLTILFAMLWIVQMLGMVFLAVNDGDDAYYMAIANVAESSDSMYTVNVYAFGNTELTYRYALAPFPIWIAFLSRISGVHTLTIGHIILGVILVTMSYVIYYKSSQALFGHNKKKCLQLLIFTALLNIWGNTSSHTAESFLLLRSRQGKALVAGIVFPAMIYLLLRIGRQLEKHQSISVMQYGMATVVILTGCLGSTLGGSLVILLWGSALFFLSAGYRRWSILLPGVLCALPGVLYAVIYMLAN